MKQSMTLTTMVVFSAMAPCAVNALSMSPPPLMPYDPRDPTAREKVKLPDKIEQAPHAFQVPKTLQARLSVDLFFCDCYDDDFSPEALKNASVFHKGLAVDEETGELGPLDDEFRANLRTSLEFDYAKWFEELKNGNYDKWQRDHRQGPRGSLALVLMASQFPRIVYKDDPRAFDYDEIGVKFARNLINNEHRWYGLHPIERAFALLPFAYSEEPKDHDTSLAEYDALLRECESRGAAPHIINFVEEYRIQAYENAAIVKRFRRFPERNALLGRESTPEEKEYLEDTNPPPLFKDFP